MDFGFLCLLLSFLRLSLADITPFINDLAYQQGELGPYPTQTFFSDLDVIAPVPNVIVKQQSDASSKQYVTWAAHGDNITTVPQLLDAETLSVVYQGPRYDEDTFGFNIQTCNNTDYLIWWAGTNIDGRAGGHYYIFNSTYHQVWNVSSVDLEYGDGHDIYLTSDCHVVFTAYQSYLWDLKNYGLNDSSWLLDSYFQEVDLATNELVFQWRASDHVDLRDSFWLPEIEEQGDYNWHGWDFFHINSVQKDHQGNFLVSARHTCAVYYIDGVTGSIIWTLGGMQNHFTDLSDYRATDFSWQHDARWIDNSLTSISLYDDRSCGYFQAEDPISRGIVVNLDYNDMTAELVAEYRAPDNITSMRKGGMHLLENSNTLLGYGSEPAFTEFAPNGTILWDVRFGPIMQDIDRETADNYRAYKLDWVGNPSWSPRIAPGPSIADTPITMFNVRYEDVYADLANDSAYFSWNGATRLAKWLVLAADEPADVIRNKGILQQTDKTGFETGVFIGDAKPYICAIALDKHDQILGVTPLLHLPSGTTTSIEDNASSLHKQFTTFKRRWNNKHSHHNNTIRIAAFIASLVVLAFGAVIWYRCRQLGRLILRVRHRKGYQALQHDDETVPEMRSRRRNFSVSSAIDESIVFGAHEFEPDDVGAEQDMVDRRLLKPAEAS